MEFSFRILILTACTFAVFQLSNSLECYHCVQAAGGECDNPSENSNFKKDCPQKDMVCVVVNTTTPTESKIERDCAPKNVCDGKNNDKVTCSTCEDDLCNSSNNLLPFLTLGAGSFVALLIGNRYF